MENTIENAIFHLFSKLPLAIAKNDDDFTCPHQNWGRNFLLYFKWIPKSISKFKQFGTDSGIIEKTIEISVFE